MNPRVYNTPWMLMQTSGPAPTAGGAMPRRWDEKRLHLDDTTDCYIMRPPLTNGAMATSKNPHARILRELAALMLSVAGESVSMVKRSSLDTAAKLKPKDEWRIYLEFLKILFNFADRCSALYIPVREQPQFMNGLEDAVSERLKEVMAPMLASDADPMEIVVTIGNTVAESRNLYERFKFLITEDTKEKEACFAMLGERVAEAMGVAGNGMVASSAILCTTAIVPAMKQLFENLTGVAQPSPESASVPAAGSAGATEPSKASIGNEIKLISVMASIQGEEVETRWGLHPQFRRDLTPEESKRLTKLMNRATQILAERYASVAFSEKWASWQSPGQA